jgi:hypothetical protein
MSFYQARILVVVAALLAGIIVGIGAGILAKADGCSVWAAVLRGGGTVGVTVALILGMASSSVRRPAGCSRWRCSYSGRVNTAAIPRTTRATPADRSGRPWPPLTLP